jgi:hypothetical protein
MEKPMNCSLPTLKIFLSLTLFFYLNVLAFSQNLVPNGGFEEGITCPSFVGNVTEECAHWYASIAAPIGLLPTPDWFHTCSDVELYSPPELVFGYQLPYSGEGFIALYSYNGEQNNYREIIGVELIAPLVVGNSYLVEFMVSGVERPGVVVGSNNLGFNFSTNQFYSYLEFPINLSHYTTEDILPIGEWTAISEVFVADSTYNYLHIGNFYDNLNTVIDTSIPGSKSYYAIENVSVTELLSSDGYSKLENNLSIYPNPVHTKLTLESINRNLEISKIVIKALDGATIRSYELNARVAQYELDLSTLHQGLFILQIVTPKTTYYEKFIKF